MKKLIIMGPPGAGKGTQAKKIADYYNIPHISTGDIFRDNISKKTELGLLAKAYLDKGELVPDEVTIKIVIDRLMKSDCIENGFLLDGFPRTINQAIELDNMLKKLNWKIDAALNIVVPYDIIIDRIVGRRVCENCGQTYHTTFNKAHVPGVCNICGAKLVQRKDDTYDVIKNRLDVYDNQTSPLIAYYKDKELLKSVDGNKNLEEVFASIKEVLGE